MKKAEQIREKQEEEELADDEEESSLVHVRKSRNGIETVVTDTLAAVDDGAELSHNGHVNNGAEIQQKITELDGVLEDEPEEEETTDGEQEKKNLVFFHKAQGVDSTTSTDSGENQTVENLHDDLILQTNSTTGINNEYEANLENTKSSNEIESAIDLVNDEENDLEVAEVDVESVIKTQNTHDLYCPNCNSCITRRVILRKRKRSNRTPDDEVKRNKIKTATDVDDEEDAQILNVDEDGRDKVPYLFRCLSCFSFFIPMGDRDNDKSGIEKIQDEQALPSVKKSWYTFMFSPKKQETTVEQGSSFQTDVGKSDVRVTLSSNIGGQPSFLQNDPSPLTKQKPSSDENLIIGFGDKSDMTKTETADATMDHFESCAEDMKGSKSSGEVPVSSAVTAHSMSSQVTNFESSEAPVSSFSHQDGLKLVITNSKEGQMKNQTLEYEDSDKDVIPLSTPVSELNASNVDGNWNISVVLPRQQEQDFTATVQTESFVENKNVNADFSCIDPGHIHPTETSEHTFTKTKFEIHSGKDTVITVDSQPNISQTEDSSLLQHSTLSSISGGERTEAREEYGIEVIKSIVYGGLAEMITSLSVVSSAAGGGAATLNILALGMASLIGGLFIIFHNLWELRCDHVEDQVNNQISDQVTEQRDRYKKLLGRRKNFLLHAAVAITSYLVFGLVPPLIYGFTFRKTDDKQLKLLAVAAASLFCLVGLAVGRAHVQRSPRPYFTCVATFVILGYMGSGVSYAAGKLAERLLEKLGIFQMNPVSGLASIGSGWESY